MLKLKDLDFDIWEAEIVCKSAPDGKLDCNLEINTKEKEIDEYNWAPSLMHQGLIFDARTINNLENTSHYWKGGSEYENDNPPS